MNAIKFFIHWQYTDENKDLKEKLDALKSRLDEVNRFNICQCTIAISLIFSKLLQLFLFSTSPVNNSVGCNSFSTLLLVLSQNFVTLLLISNRFTGSKLHNTDNTKFFHLIAINSRNNEILFPIFLLTKLQENQEYFRVLLLLLCFNKEKN